MTPVRVILESPLSATTADARAANVRYAIECLRDSLRRGESPLASHIMWSRNVANAAMLPWIRAWRSDAAGLPGVPDEDAPIPATLADVHSDTFGGVSMEDPAPYGALDDSDPSDRRLGMEAGWAWMEVAEKQVVYVDLGVSRGMKEGIRRFLASSGWHDNDCPIRHGASADCVPGYECAPPVLFRSIRGLPQADLDRIRDETFKDLAK